MKIAVITCLLAKRNMDIYARHEWSLMMAKTMK